MEPVRVAFDQVITRSYVRRRQRLEPNTNGDSDHPVVANGVNDEAKETEALLQRTRTPRLCSSMLFEIRTPILRILLILLAMGISIALPSFANILSLTGALCSSTTAFLVPLGCYLKFFWVDDPPAVRAGEAAPYRASGLEVVFAVLALVFGIVLAIVGTVGTVWQMEKG